uniref:hypothetical protein n=1 Tax=Parerythrobacter lutipelagi TaxID=1964208 RepID=UPI0010FA1E97|nr:hypothetical protein [Parerythrobacter lutipelagi]
MDWLRRNWVYIACLLTVPAGCLLFAHGQTIPVYTDQQLASALKMAVFNPDDGRSLTEMGDQLRGLRTSRHAFMQGGISLGLAGTTLAALFLAFRCEPGFGLRTPHERSTFTSLGLACVAVFWIAEFVSFDLDERRGDMLVGGGPAYAFTFFRMLVMAPISALIVWTFGRVITGGFGALPVSLAVWDTRRTVRSWLTTLAFLVPTLLALFCLLLAATTSRFLQTPAIIVFIYLFLASRAAVMAAPIPDEQAPG